MPRKGGIIGISMDSIEFGSILLVRLNGEFLVSDESNKGDSVRITEKELELAIEAALRELIKGKI